MNTLAALGILALIAVICLAIYALAKAEIEDERKRRNDR